MTPRPGTDQTASSANSPRSASPSFLANASKILWTIAAFSAADTTALPALDEPFDVATLSVRERRPVDESAHLLGIIVENGGLEVLALWRGLTELPPKPAQKTHRGLIGHAVRLAVSTRR
jgi:hypothetical protein